MRSAWVHLGGLAAFGLLAMGRMAKVGVHEAEPFARTLGRSAEHAEGFAPHASRGANDFKGISSIPHVFPHQNVPLPDEILADGRPLHSVMSSETILIAPSDEKEAQRVFAGSLDRKETNSVIADANTARLKIGNDLLTPIDDQQVLRAIRTSKAHFISIIGHNDNGMLIFADASSIRINELSNACADAGKVCIFLSCGSSRFSGSNPGTTIELSYVDAAVISANISRMLKNSRTVPRSSQELTNDIRKVIRASEISIASADAVQVMRIPAVGMAGIGVFVVMTNPDSEPSIGGLKRIAEATQ